LRNEENVNTAAGTYFIGWLAALVVVWVSLPVWQQVCRRTGLLDAPGHRKLHGEPIPLAGGLAVLTGLLGSAIIVLCVSEPLREHVLNNVRVWTAILGGSILMTLLGVLDDRHALGPGAKFVLQALVALGVAAAGLRITLFVANPVFQYGITVLWILAVINAFNFMDNMNGLCAGLGVVAAATFAAAASRHAQQAEAMFSLLVCGALLGFLPGNYPRARAFLGDAGSHLVGFAMAVLAILPSFYTAQDPRPFAVLIPLLILALPLGDMAWMVVLRTREGKRFYVADTNHLSHRLVRRGLSQPAAVALIWALAAAVSVIALLL
jgi:UDP-GlcNAc:undecaprenyl-phosphate GlcNAc-1-phosphate transferase